MNSTDKSNTVQARGREWTVLSKAPLLCLIGYKNHKKFKQYPTVN